MKNDYPYLKDSTFLKEFDLQRLKDQFVEVTVLSLDEQPLRAIEGRVISGTLNLDGTSAIRRTCNLTMIANPNEDITDVTNIISINKKIELKIGFINNTSSYTSYPIIWFPLGIFIIITPSISHGSDGLQISLQLKDKMCLLNGECGGTLPASTTFNEYDTIDETGAYVTVYPTIYQIIQEVVNHFGGEQLAKIIISDVDLRIKKVMKWTGSSPLYLIKEIGVNGETYYRATTNASELTGDNITYSMYENGMDIGYIYTDFIYSDDLVGDAGSSVCDILDKIKNYLGNYEYFYDVDGFFHFQEIKNYLNTSQATVELDKLTKDDYIVDLSKGKAVYVFDDSNLITAYTNAPQFNMIKNDFIVWGTRENANGNAVNCRYHLSIDNKPTVGNTYKVFFYTDPIDNLTKAKCPIEYPIKDDFPLVGTAEVFYMDTSTNLIYKWDSTDQVYVSVAVGLEEIIPTDWRTELYLAGACAEPLGKDSNYYYTELSAEWPKIYDVQNGKFYDEALTYPYDIDYFLDFIDSGAAISKINISNIGRRTKVVTDSDVNCVFEPEIPDLVLINLGADNLEDLRDECYNQGQDYIQVDSNIYSCITSGGSHNSAYEYVRELLYQYTSYNESINVTTIPIYYLEPNTRITVRDNASGIYGDYMISSISVPLDTSSTMTISCTRALERI